MYMYPGLLLHTELMVSRVMSSGAVFCQLSTLKSIVTLTVRIQYEDYHSTYLTPPPLVRVSASVRVTLTVRVQYADYHPHPPPPCHSIRVSQSNSDSTRTVRGLPPSLPPPLSEYHMTEYFATHTCTVPQTIRFQNSLFLFIDCLHFDVC